MRVKGGGGPLIMRSLLSPLMHLGLQWMYCTLETIFYEARICRNVSYAVSLIFLLVFGDTNTNFKIEDIS